MLTCIIEKISALCLVLAARGFCQRVLVRQCDVKTSTLTPTFYYFFLIIFLTCYISVKSYIYNLC